MPSEESGSATEQEEPEYRRKARLEDGNGVMSEWAECPECGSNDIDIVLYEYTMGDAADLECNNCGASTSD